MSCAIMLADEDQVKPDLEAEVKRLENLAAMAKQTGYDRQARAWKRSALDLRVKISEESQENQWGLK